MSSSAASPLNNTLHKYYSNLIGIEHHHSSSSVNDFHKNIVIFVGGLGDGVTTVPYVRDLAIELDGFGWGIVEILTSSSFGGWGTGSLARDAFEITQAVKYFKSETGGSRSKIVILGHSTGTQDVIYYLTQQYPNDKNDLAKRPLIKGAIIQASCSDREAYRLINGETDYSEKLKFAQQWVSSGKGLEVLPSEFAKSFFDTFINAERWVSLMEVRGGDDFFSSDLNSEDFAKTFGKINTKLLVVYSGNDEFVPVTIEKNSLVSRWQASTNPKYWSHYSGVVEGATHNVNNKSEPGARENLILRIRRFLTSDVE